MASFSDAHFFLLFSKTLFWYRLVSTALNTCSIYDFLDEIFLAWRQTFNRSTTHGGFLSCYYLSPRDSVRNASSDTQSPTADEERPVQESVPPLHLLPDIWKSKRSFGYSSEAHAPRVTSSQRNFFPTVRLSNFMGDICITWNIY